MLSLLAPWGRIAEEWLRSFQAWAPMPFDLALVCAMGIALLVAQRWVSIVLHVQGQTRGALRIGHCVLLLAFAVLLIQSPVELSHIALFSLLGWWGTRWLGSMQGVFAANVVGIGDELLQYMTPGRVFDPADIGLNAVAICLGSWACLGVGGTSLFFLLSRMKNHVDDGGAA